MKKQLFAGDCLNINFDVTISIHKPVEVDEDVLKSEVEKYLRANLRIILGQVYDFDD